MNGGSKSKKRGKSSFWNKFFSEVVEIPEELSMDMPRITLVGDVKLLVENHKGIISCNKNQVSMRVNKGYLVAGGKHLVLKNICREEVLLQGEIMHLSIVLDETENLNYRNPEE